jgi:chemotaxis protein MotB
MARGAQENFDDSPGAPEWMITFSDCMTLLLTFFVLLLSFSSFDEKVFRRKESALSEGLASIDVFRAKEQQAVASQPVIMHSERLDEGSEKPTERGQYESNPSTSLDFMDFQNQKVFLVPSDKVFWGRGQIISRSGRQLLGDVAALLKSVSNRVVVSEHALIHNRNLDEIGLTRAWKAAQFLIREQELDKTRFSISTTGTVSDEAIQQSDLLRNNTGTDRILEIVILERSIYR